METELQQTNNRLHEAALDGDLNTLMDIANTGVDINSRLPSSWTALDLAASNNKADAVRVLLLHGADPTLRKSDGLTALHLAAGNGHTQIVEILLEYNKDIALEVGPFDSTALHTAAARGHVAVIELLGKHMDDLDLPSRGLPPLHWAARSNHAECVEALVAAGANVDSRAAPEQETALLAAAALNLPTMVNTLLALGADIDAAQRQGRTPIMAAAYSGSVAALQILISQGANIDAMDEEGYTALFCALQRNHADAALLLLQNRLRLNTTFTDHRESALHLAISKGYYDVVEKLLEKDADIEICDSDGDTALQWAVRKGNVGIVETLIRHGAEINRQNEYTRETVLHWAIKCGHIPITHVLLKYGAEASMVDLERLEKLPATDQGRFEHCKAALEGELEEIEEEPPVVQTISSEVCTDQESHLSTLTTQNDEGGGREHDQINFDVYDIPDHTAYDQKIALVQQQIEHKQVKCNGVLCERTTSSSCITGIRYKCAICENVDLCSACIASFHNNHDARHVMIKCLLPTSFKVIRDLDDDAKKKLLQSTGDTSMDPKDLSHVILAETEGHPLLNLPRTNPTLFVIQHVRSNDQDLSKPRWKEYGQPTDDSVLFYKIDEAGNIRLKHETAEEPTRIVRPDGILHHQSTETINSIVGGILPFSYKSDARFHKWAWENRVVTRVIDIKPGDIDDKIWITVRVVDLADSPSYHALSYTWKETAFERAHVSSWEKKPDEILKQTMRINHAVYCLDESGRESYLTVSVGLRDALRRLRSKSETMTYWIDQLSINQKDLGERAFQVSGMRLFYNRAQQVTVWTGDEDGHTREVFDLFQKIAQATVLLGYPLKPEDLLDDENLDLPSISSDLWRSAINFFTRPVFSRAWVIQEIVLGQKVLVRCGDHQISWDTLSQTARLLSIPSWLRILPLSTQEKRKTHPRDSFRNAIPGKLGHVMMIAGFRHDFQSLKNLSLETLLYSAGAFEVTDERDRIHAILGIRGAKTTRLSDDIKPDYDSPAAEVFIHATQVIILEGSSLNICGINESMSAKVTPDLPSWVPDFSCTVQSAFLSFSRPNPPGPYSACGGSELIAAWPYEAHKSLLALSSYRADTISSVAQNVLLDWENLGEVIDELTGMVSSLGATYVTGEFTPDAFCRTLFGDCTIPWRVSPLPRSYHLALAVLFGRGFIAHLMSKYGLSGQEEDFTALDEARNPIIGTLMDDADAASPNWLESGSMEPDPDAVSTFGGTFMNRRFFMTGQGYMGIGARDLRVGDEIHILSGANVPFVLRKLHNTGDGDVLLDLARDDGMDAYCMVGESYVHGLMKGEALKREGFGWGGIYVL